MQERESFKRTLLAIAVAVLSTTLLFAGTRLPQLTLLHDPASPLSPLGNLAAAALAGFAVSCVCGGHQDGKPSSRITRRTHVVLCVGAALTVIVVGDSLARALGLLGGASLIRFRTPVKDPQNTTILFALLGLGGACGLGAFTIAAIGTAFLCLLVSVLDAVAKPTPRTMSLELVSKVPEFPAAHVQEVFAHHALSFEPREFLQSPEAIRKYSVTLGPRTSMNEVSTHLLNGSGCIKSLAWQAHRKEGSGNGD
jgi:hypothetical protein